MRTLWFLLLGPILVSAHGCCSTCHCQCNAPSIAANLTNQGLHITCPGATCACVLDELDGCSYGGTWYEDTLIPWHDARWHRCIQIMHDDPLSATALLRWWDETQKCTGHAILRIETEIDDIGRDVFVDFESVKSYIHQELIHNTFYVNARSGCETCDRPLAGQTVMFYQVEMTPPQIGAHVEIIECAVETTEGPTGDVLTVNPISTDGTGPHNGTLNANKTRITYTAFWDDVSNSPYHNIMCTYAIFNGTNASTHPSSRPYMIADPNDNAIIWN